jgi:hypothetical protein
MALPPPPTIAERPRSACERRSTGARDAPGRRQKRAQLLGKPAEDGFRDLLDIADPFGLTHPIPGDYGLGDRVER